MPFFKNIIYLLLPALLASCKTQQAVSNNSGGQGQKQNGDHGR